jgi:hypothetical protein
MTSPAHTLYKKTSMKTSLKAFVVVTIAAFTTFGLSGCGSSDPVAAATNGANGGNTSGSLTLGGSNNSGKTSFTPTGVDTCFAVKTAALLNVNCNALVGTSFVGFSFVLEGSPVKDAVFNVVRFGAGSSANAATTMIYSQVPNGNWGAVAGGTVKITDITSTTATLQFTGVSLAAISATTPATGTITADGSITVGIK